MNLRLLIRYEWLVLTRSRLLPTLALVLLLTGGYAILYGRSFLAHQRTIAHSLLAQNDSVRAVFREKFALGNRPDTVRVNNDKITNPFTTETYLSRNVAIHLPSGLAGLCIGGRDLWPLYHKVSARSLFYDGDGVKLPENYGELTNPQKLLAGNFDLAFVFIYLLPLLIIALGYNVLSQEEDLGTLPQLQTMPVSLPWLIGSRLLVRFGLVIGLISLLSVVGLWGVGGNLAQEGALLLVWIGAVVVYAGFWFALCYWVAGWRWSSAINALALVGGWLLFLLIIPAMINAYVTVRYSVSSRVALLDGLRDRTGDVWEMPNRITYGAFFRQYPQYRKPVPDYFPEDGFERMDTDSALRHFNNQKMIVWHYYLTAVSAPSVQAYARQRAARFRGAETVQALNPAGLLQETLAHLAGSGYRQYEAFTRQVTEYQQALFARSARLVFTAKPLTLSDYNQYPMFTFNDQRAPSAGLMGWPLVVLSCVLIGLGTVGLHVKTGFK